MMPPEPTSDTRRHELYADIAEQVARRAIDNGVPEEKAIDLGNHMADFLATHWKGQHIYFSSDRSYRLSERDWEIFRRFARGNANDLAKEFGLSYVRVHQIYKRCLLEYRAKIQDSLFDQDPELGAA